MPSHGHDAWLFSQRKCDGQTAGIARTAWHILIAAGDRDVGILSESLSVQASERLSWIPYVVLGAGGTGEGQ